MFFFFHDTPTTDIYTLSLHDALPIYRDRIVSTASTSQPGLILILMRRYPAARSIDTRSASCSSESCMPIDTPDSIDDRQPPSASDSGTPRWFAYRSHAAISTAAFAMLWPRMAASAG